MGHRGWNYGRTLDGRFWGPNTRWSRNDVAVGLCNICKPEPLATIPGPTSAGGGPKTKNLAVSSPFLHSFLAVLSPYRSHFGSSSLAVPWTAWRPPVPVPPAPEARRRRLPAGPAAWSIIDPRAVGGVPMFVGMVRPMCARHIYACPCCMVG